MPVQMLCPNLRCRKVLSVPDDVRGRIVKCQQCETLFKVPEAKGGPAKPATPPSDEMKKAV